MESGSSRSSASAAATDEPRRIRSTDQGDDGGAVVVEYAVDARQIDSDPVRQRSHRAPRLIQGSERLAPLSGPRICIADAHREPPILWPAAIGAHESRHARIRIGQTARGEVGEIGIIGCGERSFPITITYRIALDAFGPVLLEPEQNDIVRLLGEARSEH